MVCYVSITGTTTAGKTTLLRALQAASPKVRVIPQATCRERRPDDLDEYFRFFDESTFEAQSFATRYGNYGLLAEDMETIASCDDNTLCVSISGARELTQLAPRLPAHVRPFNILVRYTPTMEDELATLHTQVGLYFSGPELKQRIASHTRLMQEAFFNEGYIAEHIHLVLERLDTLAVWLEKTLKGVRASSRPDMECLVHIEEMILHNTIR